MRFKCLCEIEFESDCIKNAKLRLKEIKTDILNNTVVENINIAEEEKLFSQGDI